MPLTHQAMCRRWAMTERLAAGMLWPSLLLRCNTPSGDLWRCGLLC